MKSSFIPYLAFLLHVLFTFPAYTQVQPLDGLDVYIQEAMQEWKVPGLAIAVVKDDSIVWAKGFGVRDICTQAPVDEHTIFAIGSATNAFTAASLAMLISEGKLKWDDPVFELLPGFQLYDPYVTREISVRDLLSHRSGLSGGGGLWYGSSNSRDEILHRIRYLEPSWSFRSQFGYQNIMYLAAGQIIPAQTDTSWDAFIQERIFRPLGMLSSNTSTKMLKHSANLATPHSELKDTVRTVPWRRVDNIGPALSINSNILDMARWIKVQLEQGFINGHQLLDSALVEEMHTPQMVISREKIWEVLISETHFPTYGLGCFLYDYRGQKVVDHGGGFDGMRAEVAMLPEKKLGVVILSNLGYPNFLPLAIKYTIFDKYLGMSDRDWSKVLLERTHDMLAQIEAEQKKREESRVIETNPSLPLEQYAGTYTDDMYGEATVESRADTLFLRYGLSSGPLEHWHYDTFQLTWQENITGKSFVTFVLGSDGNIEEIKVENLTGFTRASNSDSEAE